MRTTRSVSFVVRSAIVALLTIIGLTSSVHGATQAQIDAARSKALAWLLIRQRADGSWRGAPGTEVVATASALEALNRAGAKGYPYVAGVSWLANAPITSVDSLARKIVALRLAGVSTAGDAQRLIGWRNTTLTWGAYDKFETSFPDTPLAVAAIRTSGVAYSHNDIAAALCAIAASQQTGGPAVAGGWSYIAPGTMPPSSAVVSGILPTTQNVLEVEATRLARGFTGIGCSGASYTLTTIVTNGINWLLTQRRNLDGGFGDGGVSRVFDTALVYQVLSTIRPADPATGPALDFLVARQAADGGWNADAVQTALVLKAFPRPALPLVDTDTDGVPDVVEALLGTDSTVADSRWLSRGTGTNTLFALTPTTALRGSAAFTLTVDGEGFAASSVVQWNGAARTTTYVNASRLLASIAATDLVAGGTAEVTVFTPAPGKGTSIPLLFTIANPVPSASTLVPAIATGGGAAFALTVTGQNFVNGSVVRWNGSNRPTTFLSPTQLRASVSASDLAIAGAAQVTVFNATPGGGRSAPLVFTISQPTAEIVLDNGQTGTTFTGTWTPSMAPTPFGASSLVSAGAGIDTFRWTPTIPATGTYTVYVWWTSTATRSTTVPYSVRHAGGTKTFTVNQQQGGGAWQPLGTFAFNAGTGGWVEVSDVNGVASADAARFVPSGVAGRLTVTKLGAGSGTVTSSPAGISCGADCMELYPSGTVVTLTAVPGTGSRFGGWSGDADCADGALTMSASRNCTAVFTGNEIVIDNGQAGTTFSGTWSAGAAPSPFGVNSLVSAGAGIDTYRWTPTIPAARNYAVYVWWTSDSTRSQTVSYTIRHSLGQDSFLANQQAGGGQWQLVGTFAFAAGAAGSVEVSDIAGGGTVSADAVRFVPQ